MVTEAELFLPLVFWAFGLKVIALFEATLGDFPLSEIIPCSGFRVAFHTHVYGNVSFFICLFYVYMCTCGDKCVP